MLRIKWETNFKETDPNLWTKIPTDWKIKITEKIKANKPNAIAMGPFGSNITTDNFVPSGIPVIRGVNLTRFRFYESEFVFLTKSKADELKSSNAVPKDIVITHRGTLGQVGIIPENCRYQRYVVSQSQMKLSCNESIADPYFVFYFLKSPIGQYLLLRNESPTGVPAIAQPLTSLKLIPVSLPDTDEQRRIVEVLTSLDDLIENKERQNDILEKIALAIFKNWFIDFEPFKDEELIDSGTWLGKIPKGWRIKPIGELAKIRNGISYSGKEKFEDQVQGSYVFITLNNTIEGGGFKPVYAWIKSERIKEHHFLKEGDLIIPNTEQTKDERLLGSPGIVFFPPDYENEKGIYSHHITRIFPFNQKYNLYLYLFLRFTREDSASFATGTGVLGMDIKNFRTNKLVIVPPQPILGKFHSIVEPLFPKIILNHKQVMILRKVRDTLLPLLVFGKLRVEEI